MANKKKIAEREHALQRKKTARIVQIGGGIALVLVVSGLVWLFVPGTSSNVLEIPPETLTAVADSSEGGSPTSDALPVNAQQYDAPPPLTIDTAKKYFAHFRMAKGGEFTVELYPDKAPITVNSFVFLARQGFFDGVTFHRVLEGFMAQGGDPTGTGAGGPGYQFQNEDNDLKFDKAGVVAMANAGRDTNGSQFFITFGPAEYLNGDYTIFGQVTDGMHVVNGITLRDPDQNPTFQGDAIESVTITEA